MLEGNTLKELEEVNRECLRCGVGVLVLYGFGLVLLYLNEINKIRYMDAEERGGAALRCALLLGWLIMRHPPVNIASEEEKKETRTPMPPWWKEKEYPEKELSYISRFISVRGGITSLRSVIMGIAIITNGIIAVFPIPFILNIRFLEKTTLIFLMMYMVEIVDAPPYDINTYTSLSKDQVGSLARIWKKRIKPIVLAFWHSLPLLCQLIRPVLLGKSIQTISKVLAFISFISILPRLIWKYTRANDAQSVLSKSYHLCDGHDDTSSSPTSTPGIVSRMLGWNPIGSNGAQNKDKPNSKSAARRLQRLIYKLDCQDYAKRAILSASLFSSTACLSTLFLFSQIFRFKIETIIFFAMPEISEISNNSWTKVAETILDVFTILIFADTIIDAEYTIFDPAYRVARYGTALRSLLGSVWASCTDVLVMSWTDEIDHQIGTSICETVILSPSAFTLLLGKDAGSLSDYFKTHHSPNTLQRIFSDNNNPTISNNQQSNSKNNDLLSILPDYICYSVQRNSTLDTAPFPISHASKIVEVYPAGRELELAFTRSGLEALLDYARRCIPTKNQTPISDTKIHEIFQPNGNRVQCEVSIGDLRHSCLVLVIRDISNRIKQVEFEKSLVAQDTARRRDLETNRFIRHEMKNGVLSALGYCQLALEQTKEAQQSLDYLYRNDSGTARVLVPYQDKQSTAAAANTAVAIGNGSNTAGLVARPETYANECPHETTDCAEENPPNIATPKIEQVNTATVMISDYIRGATEALRDTLNTVLQEALTRDLIHGSYTPKRERVFLPHIYAAATGQTRYKASVDPISIFSDTQLLRMIHSNAVSNAVKYGRPNGTISVIARYDAIGARLTVHIRNEPSPRDGAILLQLSSNDIRARVFSQGVRLHAATDTASSGNGGWIMSKCAEALDGFCDIQFFKDATVFTLSIPAQTFVQTSNESEQHTFLEEQRGTKHKRGTDSNDHEEDVKQVKHQRTTVEGNSLFQPSLSIPTQSSQNVDTSKTVMLSAAETIATDTDVRFIPSTFKTASPVLSPSMHDNRKRKRGGFATGIWGIGIDDAALQRLMLKRIFDALDIPNERIIVLGATEAECTDFGDFLIRHALKYPDDAHIIIADENLDVTSVGGIRTRISGSILLEKARAELTRLQCPARVLLLVRSANDSVDDISTYMRRCHGVLTKAPFSREEQSYLTYME